MQVNRIIEQNYGCVLYSSVLASGIVSTALQCGKGRCSTQDLHLNNPVIVHIQHSDAIKVCVMCL